MTRLVGQFRNILGATVLTPDDGAAGIWARRPAWRQGSSETMRHRELSQGHSNQC